MSELTAKDIKLALMKYFRFQRQWICATECLNCDVLAITDKDIHEVEVKVSKYDLWKGEARKGKHKPKGECPWPKVATYFPTQLMPTKFSVCVPDNLESEALKWVEEINPNYGVAVCNYSLGSFPLWIKSAVRLNVKFNKKWTRYVMMRVVSENIGLMEKLKGKF